MTQRSLCSLATLPQALFAVGVPRAALLCDAAFDGHIDDAALTGDSFAVHKVELGLAERRRHLVFDDLRANAVTHDLAVLLNAVDAANINTHAGEELQGSAACGSFGVAEHHTDLLAELVDEDAGCVRF